MYFGFKRYSTYNLIVTCTLTNIMSSFVEITISEAPCISITQTALYLKLLELKVVKFVINKVYK